MEAQYVTANQIKLAFAYYVSQYQGEEVSPGAITGVLTRACKSNENRHMVLKFLTDKWSSKEFDRAEWHALNHLVEPGGPVGGKWQSGRGDAELERICGIILAAAVDQPGQTQMFTDDSPVKAGADEARKATFDNGVAI